MTPKERKAIAMRQECRYPIRREFAYPECCSYHEGFDAALALLVKEQIVEVRPHERRWSFTIEDTPLWQSAATLSSDNYYEDTP